MNTCIKCGEIILPEKGCECAVKESSILLCAPCSAISEQELNRMDVCRHLLPYPGPEVSGQLIAEIRRLREVWEWVAGQKNLFFAECSQAEEIVTRCKNALAPNAKGQR